MAAEVNFPGVGIECCRYVVRVKTLVGQRLIKIVTGSIMNGIEIENRRNRILKIRIGLWQTVYRPLVRVLSITIVTTKLIIPVNCYRVPVRVE